MEAEVHKDASWDVAHAVTKEWLAPPSVLSGLVRRCWGGSISQPELIALLNSAAVPERSLVSAGQLIDPQASNLTAALTALGARGAAAVAAIYFSCSSIAGSMTSAHASTTILQGITDTIEIGYHFALHISTRFVKPFRL